MSFVDLETRFKSKVNELYESANYKFNDGRASKANSDDPLITRAPGKGYFGKTDSALGRSVPISSTAQDLRRLTRFQLSSRGVVFLLKQQLLQTGNTFAITRIINPAFVVANAVPFLHIKRNLRPLGELLLKTDRSDGNVRKMGMMQEESYNRLRKWKRPTFIATHLSLDAASTGGGFGSRLLGAVGNKLAQAFSPIANTFSALLAKRNIGDKLGFKVGIAGNAPGWALSRPELAANSIVSDVDLATTNFKERHPDMDVSAQIKSFDTEDIQNALAYLQDKTKFVQYGTVDSRNSKLTVTQFNAQLRSDNGDRSVLYPYAGIQREYPEDVDAITVSFAMGGYEHIPFRAYIKDLTQTVNPEYKSYSYIGRLEKFITYTSVQRDLSFKLGIIASTKEELDVVWRRINYLTGLAYPIGFHRGIFQPNITRLTIGSLYIDQPGYITSLDTNFNELGESWDLDEEIPIAATMNIKFTLIEKASRIASSPFYGINESAYRRSDKSKLKNDADFSDSITITDQLTKVKLPPPATNPVNNVISPTQPNITGTLVA